MECLGLHVQPGGEIVDIQKTKKGVCPKKIESKGAGGSMNSLDQHSLAVPAELIAVVAERQ